MEVLCVLGDSTFSVMFFFECYGDHRNLHVLTHSFPTRRSSDLLPRWERVASVWAHRAFYLLLILLPLTGLMAVSGGAEADGRTSTPLLGGIQIGRAHV